MKYIKLFESFDDDKTDWVEVIEFMRNEFYDKIEFVKSGMLEFEDRIDGVFNKQQYRIKDNTPCLSQLQLGFATETSYESFFMKECSLIINRCQDQEEIIKNIESCSGIERFKSKLKIIKNRRRKNSYWAGSDTIYYPYYMDKDMEKENTEERYIKWCNRILNDIFPGWKSYVQLRIMGNSNAQFWVHLVDKTNLPKNNILESYDNIIEKGSVKCHNCKWTWKIENEDDDKYLCHKCGYDNKISDFDFPSLEKWERNKSQQKLTD